MKGLLDYRFVVLRADCKINVLGANFEAFVSFNILVIIWRLAYLQVAADLPFLHDSEVNLLNRICKLGTYFQRFLAFCKKYSDVSPFIRENSRDGKFYGFNPNFTFVCFVIFFFCFLGLGLDLNCLKLYLQIVSLINCFFLTIHFNYYSQSEGGPRGAPIS